MAKRFAAQGPNLVAKLEERVFDGYTYVFRYEKNETIFVMCKDRLIEQCRGAGKIIADTFIETTGHSHAPIDELHEVSTFFRELYRSTITEMRSITSIFNSFEALYPQAARFVDKMTVLKRMTRWRLTIVLPHPRSFDHLLEMLYSDEWRVLRLHIRGHVDVTVTRNDGNEEVAAVFFDRILIQKLIDSTELHVSSSTRLLPENMNTREIVTIIAIHCGHAIPCVWGFLKSPEPEAYAAVFAPLQGLIRPDIIYGNFENRLYREATRAYPLADIKPSFYYYCLILFGVAKEEGLNLSGDVHLKTMFKNVMALALLPPEKIRQAFEAIRDSQPPGYGPWMGAFFQHVQEVWLEMVKPEKFSIYGDRRGITDPAVAVVKIMETGVGTGRNISTLLSRGILRVLMQSHSNFERLNNRRPVSTTPRVRSLVSTTRLNDVWKMVRDEAIDWPHFFDSCSTLLQPFFANIVFRDESPVPNLQPIRIPEIEEDFEIIFPAFNVNGGPVGEGNEIAYRQIEVVDGANEPVGGNNGQVVPDENVALRNDIENDWLCVVCRTNGIRYACLPCLHVAFCEQCAERCMQDGRENEVPLRCPLCRKISTHYSPAFFPGRD